MMEGLCAFELENIEYWTNRAKSYSKVNQDELHSNQKFVWKETLEKNIQAYFVDTERENIKI